MNTLIPAIDLTFNQLNTLGIVALTICLVGLLILVLSFIFIKDKKRIITASLSIVILILGAISFKIVNSCQTELSNAKIEVTFKESFGKDIEKTADDFSDYTSSIVEQNNNIQNELPNFESDLETIEDTVLENGADLRVNQSGDSLLITITLTENEISTNIVYILEAIVYIQEKYAGKADSALITVSIDDNPVLLANLIDDSGVLKLGALGFNWIDEEYKNIFNEYMQ